MLFTNYIFKYSVDVLGVAAASIGWVLLVTRLWDAVSDPMVAYLSDSTHTRAGRRRPWLLGSAIPIVLTAYFMWNPPRSLEGTSLIAWMFVWIALWETAMTTFFIPYMALGSEVTMNHHDRTRIAGYRHILGGLGQLSVIGSVWLISRADPGDAQRDVAMWLLAAGGAVAALLMIGSVWRIREPREHLERRATRPLHSILEVARNPHLLRLVTIYFFEISGSASMGLLVPFVCEYVVGQATLFPKLLLCFQIASYASTPLLVRLSRGLGKKGAWIVALSLQVAGFAATFAAGRGDAAWLIACLCVVGLGAAGGHVLGMSILADSVDYDEWRSGERREALHYAAINIARKVSAASLAALVGVALGRIGYAAHVEQSAETLFGLSALLAAVPSFALLLAMGMLSRLRLGETEHARLRADLDGRRV